MSRDALRHVSRLHHCAFVGFWRHLLGLRQIDTVNLPKIMTPKLYSADREHRAFDGLFARCAGYPEYLRLISQGSVAACCIVNKRWKILSNVYGEFSWESVGDRILKIGLRSYKFVNGCSAVALEKAYNRRLTYVAIISHISGTTRPWPQIFGRCYLWPWHGPVSAASGHAMYFRFRGWRHISL